MQQLIPFLPGSARVGWGMSLKQMWEWTTLDTGVLAGKETAPGEFDSHGTGTISSLERSVMPCVSGPRNDRRLPE